MKILVPAYHGSLRHFPSPIHCYTIKATNAGDMLQVLRALPCVTRQAVLLGGHAVNDK